MFPPTDIRPKWLNPIRRLQSIARRHNNGIAVLQITVVVDSDGDPVFWTNPKKVLIEPKAKSREFIDLLMEMQGSQND